jgi:hypothetical protein
MKLSIALAASLLMVVPANAQTDTSNAAVYLPSCLAAADIAQGKHPAADSTEAAKQLRKAALCFGAITAVAGLEPLFKPEFAACPPADKKITFNQMVLTVTGYLKSHREQLGENFHQLAAAALVNAWPCAKPSSK